MYRLAEVHPPAELERFGILYDLVTVRAAADEHHAEVRPAVGELAQRIEDYPYPLVPHHAPHEEEHRHALRQVDALRHLGDQLIVHAALGEVHAVWHDDVIPLVAELMEVLPRAAADRPDLVAGGDILCEDARRLLLQ